MTYISEEYVVAATQAIGIMPIATWISIVVQQVYIDLLNATYMDKTQVEQECLVHGHK